MNPSTITINGVVFTITYNPDGSVASVTSSNPLLVYLFGSGIVFYGQSTWDNLQSYITGVLNGLGITG